MSISQSPMPTSILVADRRKRDAFTLMEQKEGRRKEEFP